MSTRASPTAARWTGPPAWPRSARGRRRGKAAERPARRFRHHLVLVLDQRLEVRDHLAEAAIAGGDRGVADHAVTADPLDWRTGEQLPERRIVELEQVGERRRGELGPRQEGAVGAGRVGEAVPRADRQAIVAAIDAVADRLPEFLGDRALMLDGEIGDAAARIELERRRKRVGRADVEAARAAAAADLMA